MSGEITKQKVEVVDEKSWKVRSWCKRLNEPLEIYAIFNDYLHDEEIHPYKWIKSLSPEYMKSLPKNLGTKKELKRQSMIWRWALRKNDYINTIWDSARKSQDEKLQNLGSTFGEGFGYLREIFVSSLKKKYESGYEMEMSEILTLTSKIADIQMQISENEERKKTRLQLDKVPTAKIKQLLDSLELDED